MNTYHYKLSDSVITEVQAENIIEADAKYEQLTGLKAQKTSVTIDFEKDVSERLRNLGKFQEEVERDLKKHRKPSGILYWLFGITTWTGIH